MESETCLKLATLFFRHTLPSNAAVTFLPQLISRLGSSTKAAIWELSLPESVLQLLYRQSSQTNNSKSNTTPIISSVISSCSGAFPAKKSAVQKRSLRKRAPQLLLGGASPCTLTLLSDIPKILLPLYCCALDCSEALSTPQRNRRIESCCLASP